MTGYIGYEDPERSLGIIGTGNGEQDRPVIWSCFWGACFACLFVCVDLCVRTILLACLRSPRSILRSKSCMLVAYCMEQRHGIVCLHAVSSGYRWDALHITYPIPRVHV